MKFGLCQEVQLGKPASDDIMIKLFETTVTPLMLIDDIGAAVKTQINKLVGKVEKFIRNGSGWTVESVRKIILNTSKLVPNSPPPYRYIISLM